MRNWDGGIVSKSGPVSGRRGQVPSFSSVDRIAYYVSATNAVIMVLLIGSIPYLEPSVVYDTDVLPIVQVGVIVGVAFLLATLLYEYTVRAKQSSRKSEALQLREKMLGNIDAERLRVFDDRAELVIALSGVPLLALTLRNPFLASPMLADVGIYMNIVGSGILWFAYKGAKIWRALDLRLYVFTHAVYFTYAIFAFLITVIIVVPALQPVMYYVASILALPILVSQLLVLLVSLGLLVLVIFVLAYWKSDWPRSYVDSKWNELAGGQAAAGSRLTEEEKDAAQRLLKTEVPYSFFYVILIIGVIWLRVELEVQTPAWGVLSLIALLPPAAHYILRFFGICHLVETIDTFAAGNKPEPVPSKGWRGFLVKHRYGVLVFTVLLSSLIWSVVLRSLEIASSIPLDLYILLWMAFVLVLLVQGYRELRKIDHKYGLE